MTKVLTDSVEETYKQVFGSQLDQKDKERIEFLRAVTTERVVYKKELMPLDKAAEIVTGELEDVVEDLQTAKREEKEDLSAEAASLHNILLDYCAIKAMRQEWYLQSEKLSKHDVKVSIVPELLEAGLEYVQETLNDCMEVLRKQRIKDLATTLDKAFAVKGKLKDKAISLTAESLLQKNVPELTEIVLPRMVSYHAHLRGLLDSALENGHQRAVDRALKRIEDTGAPKLQEYAQNKMSLYYA